MNGVSIALIILASGVAILFASFGFVVAAAMIAALRSERKEQISIERRQVDEYSMDSRKEGRDSTEESC